jgi:hypothetical protein
VTDLLTIDYVQLFIRITLQINRKRLDGNMATYKLDDRDSILGIRSKEFIPPHHVNVYSEPNSASHPVGTDDERGRHLTLTTDLCF